DLGSDTASRQAADAGTAADIATCFFEGLAKILLLNGDKCLPQDFRQRPVNIHMEGELGRWRADNVGRQVFQLNGIVPASYASTLDRVFQLANVARPAVVQQGLHRPRRNLLGCFPGTSVFLGEMGCEQGDIFWPLTKWRQIDFHNIQTVKQILTKGTL